MDDSGTKLGGRSSTRLPGTSLGGRSSMRSPGTSLGGRSLLRSPDTSLGGCGHPALRWAADPLAVARHFMIPDVRLSASSCRTLFVSMESAALSRGDGIPCEFFKVSLKDRGIPQSVTLSGNVAVLQAWAVERLSLHGHPLHRFFLRIMSTPVNDYPREIANLYRKSNTGTQSGEQGSPLEKKRRGSTQSQAFVETHEAEPFQMRDMYMSLIDAQMQSIHRGQVATAEMIIGMYDTPPTHRWTMDEFHNVVARPEENAQGSRAGAAEASAMEEDEDDDDDAFEDAKDNEEEEDTNDSTG
ncbi:hypothetical protein LR48_Vigan07g130800 [Vigna angularis]|uniref:Aminotransferase-like plant mobile domain-containing protein n=1 Tax=Phaseolus angularis TaxID=3914 RepID=A0A0L9UYI7_PHAAN|nr:hypothetical protein LR48_Vigan07g130800 [Vigna angularis]